MKKLLRSIPSLAVIALLALAANVGQPALAADIIGKHVVKRGETLYCIGRGYGVLPSAIAQQNNIRSPFTLFPGQVLNIPATQWKSIPNGPVCTPQFASPYPSLFRGSVTFASTATRAATVAAGPTSTARPVCLPPEFYDPFLNRCRFDPNNPVQLFTNTPIPNIFMPPTSTPKPCFPPEFYDPFLNRCRLPDTATPTPTKTPTP